VGLIKHIVRNKAYKQCFFLKGITSLLLFFYLYVLCCYVKKRINFHLQPASIVLIVFTNRYLKSKIRWALFGSGTLVCPARDWLT
jgi:hypothetical protein